MGESHERPPLQLKVRHAILVIPPRVRRHLLDLPSALLIRRKHMGLAEIAGIWAQTDALMLELSGVQRLLETLGSSELPVRAIAAR